MSNSKKVNAQKNRVGKALAQAVAQRLMTGEVLAYQHRDYCCIGLLFTDGVFVCGEVYEGSLSLQAWGETCEHHIFSTRSEFVNWLAKQTDDSLAGKQLAHEFNRDNQRLTLARLRAFAKQSF